jgi:hypothetical protein
VSIFTKRNAVVGYLTLKALDRHRRRRRALRVGLYVGLGIVSVGILAGLAAVAMRRRGANGAEEASDETATPNEDATDEDASEIVGEYVTAPPEPIPAT